VPDESWFCDPVEALEDDEKIITMHLQFRHVAY